MPLFESHPETASLLAAAPEDAAALANALEIHRSLVCRLIKRGLIGSQALFIFPRNNAGALEYDRWLSDVLDVQSEDKLSSASVGCVPRTVFFLDGD